MFRRLVPVLVVLVVSWVSREAPAEPTKGARAPWTAEYPTIEEDIAAGEPLTLLVVIPLCDSRVIACGGQGAGDPGSLAAAVERLASDRPQLRVMGERARLRAAARFTWSAAAELALQGYRRACPTTGPQRQALRAA